MSPLDDFLKKELNKEINSLFIKQPPTPPKPRKVRGDYSPVPPTPPRVHATNPSIGGDYIQLSDYSLRVFGLVWFGLGVCFGILAMLLYFSKTQ